MVSPWGRLKAQWLAVVQRSRLWHTRVRGTKTYGRVKRLAREVLVMVAATTATSALTQLLGR